MASAVEPTVVKIHGQEYRIRGGTDTEEVARAAALVDSSMTQVRENTGIVDTLNLSVLTALNLANQLLSGDGGVDLEQSQVVESERVQDLLTLISDARHSNRAPL